jgi:uncharacterized protein YsxB (DUF464 family)
VAALEVRGHAAFAPAGRDIVCAAVSALVLSTAYGLRAHCSVSPVIIDSRNVYALRVPARANAKASAVLETLISGLAAIARSYPSYVRVRQGSVAAA